MWTLATRAQHDRDGLRYPSDLTDQEWAILEPLMPPSRRTGRRRIWSWREILNAMFYVLRGGVPWRMLPRGFPRRQTVWRWFAAWRDSGLFETINHHLLLRDRERAGREASPSAAAWTARA